MNKNSGPGASREKISLWPQHKILTYCDSTLKPEGGPLDHRLKCRQSSGFRRDSTITAIDRAINSSTNGIQ